MTTRTKAVCIGHLRVVSVYQSHSGYSAEVIEDYRGEVVAQVQRSGPEKVLLVRGDHNVHVGGGEQRGRARSGHGIGDTSEAGEELIIWYEENIVL